MDQFHRAQIKRAREASFGLYGTRRAWNQSRSECLTIAKGTVEWLMAVMDLAETRLGPSAGDRHDSGFVGTINGLCNAEVNRQASDQALDMEA